jgi:hypothetical protein
VVRAAVLVLAMVRMALAGTSYRYKAPRRKQRDMDHNYFGLKFLLRTIVDTLGIFRMKNLQRRPDKHFGNYVLIHLACAI